VHASLAPSSCLGINSAEACVSRDGHSPRPAGRRVAHGPDETTSVERDCTQHTRRIQMRLNIVMTGTTWPAPWKAAWITTICDIVCAAECEALPTKARPR
jgi:hypothetical protein